MNIYKVWDFNSKVKVIMASSPMEALGKYANYYQIGENYKPKDTAKISVVFMANNINLIK